MPITSITSPTLDQGLQRTPEFTRNNTRVGFENVVYSPAMQPPKRSVLGGIFQFLGALTTPAFLVPGVGTAIGAGGLGLSSMGGYLKSRAASQQGAAPRPLPIGYPGLMTPTSAGGGPVYSGGGAVSSDPVLDVISSSRNAADAQAVDSMR